MIDYDKELVAALSTILPTHYEMNLYRGLPTPCISYQENNNYDNETGDTIGYSTISYTVKIWGNDIATIKNYMVEVDKVLRPLGFKRISSGELYDKNSTMIQKVLTYEALANET